MTYAAPAVDRTTASAVEQGFFDFLVPYRSELLRPDQVAQSLNRKRTFVYTLINDGRLEAHGVPGRDVERYQITKRSVILYLAASANYSPDELVAKLAEVAARLTPAQYTLFISEASKRRARP